ncbi:hypothetical protein NJ959_14670 [Symplocastrum sp. BBK-W-15]|uniref:Uncharacterized protein n=1 Tax=Limnofasciculus baicalensis BBK-W-15 TaxID=2699891 RepID=A0AAE3GSF9_9CYAN|nr:hypothetical protein [Limnofasciculus baicalensis BBK-W-15]
MSNNEALISLTFSPKFQRQLRILAKKYRNIYTDVQQNNPSSTINE